MKKRISLVCLLLIYILNSLLAQSKRGDNWVTGYSGNRVDFSNNTITTHQGIYFPFKYFTAGNSCISDTNGNLVLASDGYNVYNSFGNFIEDGDTLAALNIYAYQNGWCSESQGSIFLPMDSNKYYFITPSFSDIRFNDCVTNNNCYLDLLLYSIIDMNANGGLGKVTERIKPLMQNANLRKTQMMACRHGNGKDWWLLKQEGDNADVYTFLFTQDTVYDKGVQAFAQPNWGVWDLRGQSTFNSDGSMYASTSDGSGALASLGLVFLADFDRCHGLLSNPRVLDIPWGLFNPNDTVLLDKQSVGLAFSPNNKYLYVASVNNIYQYDLQDNTWFHVAGRDSTAFASYETMYNAPDGRIYIGNFHGTSKQMSRIDNPDVKGAGCNFCPRCLRLDSLGANAYVGTPPCMPDYGLGAKLCWPLSNDEIPIAIGMDNDKLEVYPNPSSTLIYIKNRKGKKKELYNVVGELLFSTKADEINARHFARGVYYIRCEGVGRKVVIE